MNGNNAFLVWLSPLMELLRRERGRRNGGERSWDEQKGMRRPHCWLGQYKGEC